MDKGYDSEKIHQYIRENIGAESIIPVRKWNGNIYSGKYRKEMIENFNQEKYGQRNMVETVFSVIKRKYNENVRSRKYFNQIKEIKIRMLIHNKGEGYNSSINSSLVSPACLMMLFIVPFEISLWFGIVSLR